MRFDQLTERADEETAGGNREYEKAAEFRLQVHKLENEVESARANSASESKVDDVVDELDIVERGADSHDR